MVSVCSARRRVYFSGCWERVSGRPRAPSCRGRRAGYPAQSVRFLGAFLADAVSLSQRLLFCPMRTDDKRSPGGSNMRGAAGAMDAGGAGGGGSKRGDACLAEIQRLEKNRANRRNRMEKARLVVCVFSKGL